MRYIRKNVKIDERFVGELRRNNVFSTGAEYTLAIRYATAVISSGGDVLFFLLKQCCQPTEHNLRPAVL